MTVIKNLNLLKLTSFLGIHLFIGLKLVFVNVNVILSKRILRRFSNGFQVSIFSQIIILHLTHFRTPFSIIKEIIFLSIVNFIITVLTFKEILPLLKPCIFTLSDLVIMYEYISLSMLINLMYLTILLTLFVLIFIYPYLDIVKKFKIICLIYTK